MAFDLDKEIKDLDGEVSPLSCPLDCCPERAISWPCAVCALCVAVHSPACLQKAESVPFKLPDGNTLTLASEAVRAPEVLFNPAIIGQEYVGVHQLLINTISR